MPEISVRGLEMPESPIRKLAPLAAAAKKRGTKVYHLNIGQPDLPTPKVALDALKTIDRNILEYSPSQGYLSYREKLVDYYAKYDINVTADDIIITSGGSEAVLFAFLSCLNPGDEIIVPEPAYANYMAFAISAGAKIRTIATTIEEGFSLPKVEVYRMLCDAFTIPGMTMILLSALVWLTGQGALSGLGYVTSYALRMLIPRFAKKYGRHETYAEYLERKDAKGKPRGYGFLFFTGLAFMIAAIIFMILFYKYFNG